LHYSLTVNTVVFMTLLLKLLLRLLILLKPLTFLFYLRIQNDIVRKEMLKVR